MSSHYADNILLPWIKDNKWPPTETLDDLLVISIPTAASPDPKGPILWNSAVVVLFEVKTVWDSATERLNDTSVSIEVPGFGPGVSLFAGINIDMKNSRPISVCIPRLSVSGTVQFVYGTTEKKDIKLNWQLIVPWVQGSLDDGRSLFPTDRKSSFLANKLQNVKVISDSEVSALREASLSEFKVVRGPLTGSDREMILFDTSPKVAARESAEAEASFVRDNVTGAPSVTVPFLDKGNNLDCTILGIFQLVGTIFPDGMVISAILYVKILFAGPVKLFEIKGTLDRPVEANINLALAKGSVKVSAKTDAYGGGDLYIDELDLEMKFLKKFKISDLKLCRLSPICSPH